MSTCRVKRGDVGILFTDTLTDDNGPINLAGATVTFLMRKGTDLRQRDATITSAPAGEVEYVSVAADLATVGTYNQEWEITFSNGDVFTVPSNRTNQIIVIRDLDHDA